MITVRRAQVDDAPVIVRLRAAVWQETYPGIYPDELLYGYDLGASQTRFAARIADPAHSVYLFCHEQKVVGYFSFGPGNFGSYRGMDMCLNNLYILKAYTGLGLGRWAFEILRSDCAKQGISKFFCGCNVHNTRAVGFYRHMGGIQTDEIVYHESKADDIIHFEFDTGV